MPSPNVAVALQLRQNASWHVASPSYREAWMLACLELSAGRLRRPLDGEMLEVALVDTFSSVAKEGPISVISLPVLSLLQKRFELVAVL